MGSRRPHCPRRPLKSLPRRVSGCEVRVHLTRRTCPAAPSPSSETAAHTTTPWAARGERDGDRRPAGRCWADRPRRGRLRLRHLPRKVDPPRTHAPPSCFLRSHKGAAALRARHDSLSPVERMTLYADGVGPDWGSGRGQATGRPPVTEGEDDRPAPARPFPSPRREGPTVRRGPPGTLREPRVVPNHRARLHVCGLPPEPSTSSRIGPRRLAVARRLQAAAPSASAETAAHSSQVFSRSA